MFCENLRGTDAPSNQEEAEEREQQVEHALQEQARAVLLDLEDNLVPRGLIFGSLALLGHRDPGELAEGVVHRGGAPGGALGSLLRVLLSHGLPIRP